MPTVIVAITVPEWDLQRVRWAVQDTLAKLGLERVVTYRRIAP